MKAADKSSLVRWRSMDAAVVLSALSDHLKPDSSFEPRISQQTPRWHATVASCDIEMLGAALTVRESTEEVMDDSDRLRKIVLNIVVLLNHGGR